MGYALDNLGATTLESILMGYGLDARDARDNLGATTLEIPLDLQGGIES